MNRAIDVSRGARQGAWRSAFAALAALLLLVGTAGTAAAHNQYTGMNCDEGLYVVLTSYRTGGTNTVDVSIDGSPVAGSPFTFETGFRESWNVTPRTQPHTATIVVSAWDDPTGSEGWSKTINLSMPACEQATPTPEVTATPTPEVTSTPEVTATPTPEVTSTPEATPKGTVEAETGTPRATPPATDGLDTSSGEPGGGLPLVLVLLAGSSLALLPTARRRVRGR
jgi:hypothetical protein